MVRKTIISALISAGVIFAPQAAHAVGLGKLTVMSGLGQPFRGEIELLAVDRNEEGSLAARLAPPEVFQEAKVERSLALISLRFNIEQKKTGQWFVKMTSPQPINEPFLDMLVEVNWPSGRLLREYTVLLDPPGLAAEQQAAVPVEVPVGKLLPPADGAKAVVPRASGEIVAAKSKRAKGEKPRAAQVETKPVTPSETKGETYGPVKPGETLSKIASSVKSEGVNVEQMLVALFRANQQAFAGNNMNRLKTGQILRIPESGEASALEKGEAAKEIRAQAADWNAYRQKLAGAVETARPAHEDQARQAAGGKITAAVEDKASAKEAAKDVLKLSKSESVGGKPGKEPAAQDDAIARDKAIREANQRISELEKNIKDMQRLLEIRSQGMAGLQKGTPPVALAPEKPAVQPEAKPVAEEKKVEPAPAVVPAPAAEPSPLPASAAVVEEQPKPKPKPKVVVLQSAPPATPKPSFLGELLGNPLVLGGGALVALLGGLFGVRALAARRKKDSKGLDDAMRGVMPDHRTQPDGKSAAAGSGADFSAGLTDFTQTGMGSIDTTDVDPIAEAEVYMAYGRDVQAEEILREAMARDPQRYEIHLKLLEIYANRKDQGSYEALARQLYVATGGTPNPDWEKAAEMGRGLDASNPLYGAAASAEMAEPEAETASAFGESEAAVDASPDLDFNLDTASAAADEDVDIPLENAHADQQVEELASDLDFNLGQEEAAAPQGEAEAELEMPNADENLLDFDLEMPAAQAEEAAVQAPVAENLVDFDLEMPAAPAEEAAVEAPAAENLADFDLESAQSALSPEAPEAPTEAAPEEAGLDEHMLNFDLELPAGNESEKDEQTEASVPVAEPAVTAIPEFDEAMLLDLSEFVPETAEAIEAPAVTSVAAVAEPEPETVATVEAESESILISPPAMSDEAMLDFDFNLGEETAETEAPLQAATNIDLSDISLDLGAPAEEAESKPQVEDNVRFQEAATKLDLAKAYMEMGDKEGAREILLEVVQEGSDEQQEDAKKLLAELA